MCKKKTWLIMKLTCILVVVFNLNVCAVAFSQSKISLDLKNATIEEFIAAMKEQTGTQFLYNSSLMQVHELITVNVMDEELKEVLDQVLLPLKLTYEFINDVVVIKRLSQVVPDNKWVLKGKVTDHKGSPLPGVTIRLKGTTIGVSSNIEGLFSLEVKKAVDTLVVSFIGMKTQLVPVNKEKNDYVIKLEEEVLAMDEVVVVSTGYQDIDKRRLTSAITTLKMDDIKVAGLSSDVGGPCTGYDFHAEFGTSGSRTQGTYPGYINGIR